MPRQDLVDELHDTLKSDVNVFFSDRAQVAPVGAAARPSPASSAASNRDSPTVSAPRGKSGELSPAAIVALAAMILTSITLLYFVMAPTAASSAKALAQSGDDDRDNSESDVRDEITEPEFERE